MAEITEVDRRRVTLHVEVWDAQEQVGDGLHERFIIDTERFLHRVQAKQSA
jgi:predicted thioesterase